MLSAAEHVLEDKDTEEDLRLLFAPGSSMGGARPKASVIEKDGQLAIAKFPRRDDEINTVAWEAVALALARKAGIAVPMGRVEIVVKKPVAPRRTSSLDNHGDEFPKTYSRLKASITALRGKLAGKFE